jgi:hypothetical protein
MKRIVLCFLILSLVSAPSYCYAAEAQAKIPMLEDYPATEMYTGRPAAVDLSLDPAAKRFKTRLREGIRKGVNFAGSYTIVSWGCGTNCLQSVILGTETGKVLAWFNSCGDPTYGKESRLLVVNPGAEDVILYPKGCVTEYYLWDGKSLRSLR